MNKLGTNFMSSFHSLLLRERRSGMGDRVCTLVALRSERSFFLLHGSHSSVLSPFILYLMTPGILFFLTPAVCRYRHSLSVIVLVNVVSHGMQDGRTTYEKEPRREKGKYMREWESMKEEERRRKKERKDVFHSREIEKMKHRVRHKEKPEKEKTRTKINWERKNIKEKVDNFDTPEKYSWVDGRNAWEMRTKLP